MICILINVPEYSPSTTSRIQNDASKRGECIMVIRKTSYVTFEQTSNTMVVTKATYSLWNMQ